jgi:hypothetical protein
MGHAALTCRPAMQPAPQSLEVVELRSMREGADAIGQEPEMTGALPTFNTARLT